MANKIKFATKKVNGWKDRYVNMSSVYERLLIRSRKFMLDSEEKRFIADYISLKNRYNKETA